MNLWRISLAVFLITGCFLLPASGQTTLLTSTGAVRGDTNGPTLDTYGAVDISNCATVRFSLNFSFSLPWEGDGNMEYCNEISPSTGQLACPNSGGCGCDPANPTAGGCNTCWDFLWVQFLVDGALVGGDVIGDAGTTNAEQSGTISFGFCNNAGASSAQINVITQTWASNEAVNFNAISIICYEAQPTANANPDPLCAGETLNLSGSVTAPNVVSSTTWSGPGTITNPGVLNTTVNNLTAGPATFILSSTDNQGCTTTSEVTVTVDPAPVATPPTPLEICFSAAPLAGEILNLDDIIDQIRNFNPAYTVNWWFDAAGTNDINFNNPADITTLLLTMPTTVYASITDGNCESATVPVTVNINSYPTANDASLMACLGSNGLATFTPSDAEDDITGNDPSLNVSYHATFTQAENGTSPINGNVTTPIDRTLYAQVSNSAGCSVVVELDLQVGSGLTAEDATLEVCDNGSGQGLFDLTDADATVLNGQPGSVTYYLNPAPGSPINNPGNFLSGPTTVYAVIDDGTGCTSAPSQVTLDLIGFDANDVFLTFNPDSGCGPTFISPVLNTPSNPAGVYSFDISFGPLATGPNNNVTIIGQNGAMPFTYNIAEDHIFILNSVTGPGPSFCEVTFSPPLEYFIFIDQGPPAFPASLTACPNGSGQGTFNLTSLESTITGNAGLPVDFYRNAALTQLIANPGSFVSTPTTVYAVVDNGSGCSSAAVPITLTATPPPVVTIDLDTPISCASASDGAITVNVSGNGPFTFDWSDNTYDGQQILTGLSAGTYAVTVSDANGCAQPGNITLTDPPALSLNCRANGSGQGSGPGSYTFTFGGGTPFYLLELTGPLNITFTENTAGSWDTPVLPPGDYTFALTDANNCTTNCTFTVVATCDLMVQIDGTNPLCAGGLTGSISLTINSSQPIIDINWTDDTLDGDDNPVNLPAAAYSVTVTDLAGCQANAAIVLTDPPAYSLNCMAVTLPSGPTANDGVLEVTISAGPGGPYTVTYDNGSGTSGTIPAGANPAVFTQNNLPVGNYQITVTNPDLCSATCSVNLTAASCNLTLAQSSTPPTCSNSADGSTTITPAGGDGNYTYNWNDNTYDGLSTITGLTVGENLAVTVADGNGCTAALSFTVTGPAPLTISCSATGDMLSVDITSGAAGPFTVTYDNGAGTTGSLVVNPGDPNNFTAAGLPNGTYTLTAVNSNNCTATCSVVINQPTCDLVLDCSQITHPNTPAGNNGVIDFQFAGGVAPYTITWTGPVSGTAMVFSIGTFPISNLSVGAYTITLTDGAGCQETCNFTITNVSNCNFSMLINGTDLSCNGARDGRIQLILIEGTANYTFDWSDDTYDSVGSNGDLQGLPVGTYAVTVTDASNCRDSAMVVINQPAAFDFACSVAQQPSQATASDGIIVVNFVGGPAGPYTLTYNNNQGTTGTLPVVAGDNTISGLPEGSYSLTISNGSCATNCFLTLATNFCTFDLNFTNTAETCTGANDGSVTLIASGGLPPYLILWSTLDTTATVGSLPPGSYSVTVTDSNGCLATGSTTVSAGNPGPTLAAGSGGSICADSCYRLPLNFTGTGPFLVDYEVTTPGVTTPVQFTFLNPQDTLVLCPADNGLPFGTIGLHFSQIADANCVTNLDQTVNFNYLPPATGDLLATVCPGDSIVVGTTVFDAGNPSGQVILPGAASSGCDSLVNVSLGFYPASVSTITTPICPGDTLLIGSQFFFVGNSTGLVTLDNASSNGCDSLITVNLTELTPVTENFTTTVCAGDSVLIAGEFFHAGRLQDTLTLPIPAANGCDSLLAVDVTLLPTAMSAFTGEICTGDSILVGGQYFSAPRLSGLVLLPGAAANGCDSTIQVTISVATVLAGQIDPVLCPGGTLLVGDSLLTAAGTYAIVLPGAATGGCDSLVNVNLSFYPVATGNVNPLLCPGDSITIGGQTFSALNPAGTVTLPNAAANGCDSLLNVQVAFLPAATGTFTGDACLGESLTIGNQTFTATNNSGVVVLPNAAANGCDSTVVVTLNFLPGSVRNIDSLLCFGSTLAVGNQLFSASNPSGIVVLSGASATGCDSTIFVNTSYQPQLTAALGADTVLCGNQVVEGEIFLSPGDTYAFSVGFTNGSTLDFTGIAPPEFRFGLGANGVATTIELLRITAASGCPVTILNDQTIVQRSGAQLDISAPGGNFSVSCTNGNDGVLTVNVTNGVGPFQYLWSTGATTAGINNLPAGAYSVTVTDLPGCSTSATATLTAPSPVAIQASGAAAGCFGTNTGSLSIDSIFGGTGPYEYSIDNQFFSPISGFPTTVPDLASGAYTLYVQDNQDCQTSLNVAVPPGPELILDLGDDLTIQAGDSILLTPEANFTPATWVWKPLDGLSQPDSLVTYAAPLETINYLLEVADANGCTTSDVLRIFVEHPIHVYIPTAFSPNNDGDNDKIMVYAGQGVERVERFMIFDRWGNQVFAKGPFQPNDPDFGWDGLLNGEPMNAAVFVYYAEVTLVTGQVVVLEGDFVLLR